MNWFGSNFVCYKYYWILLFDTNLSDKKVTGMQESKKV